MSLGIDFSTIVVQDITFTSRKGKIYDLRDDTPTDLIIACSMAMAYAGMTETTNLRTMADMEATSKRYFEAKAALRHAVGELFRYSLPSVTDDEIGQQFLYEDQVALTAFFSNLLGQRYAALLPSTSAETTTVNQAASAETSTSTLS